MAGDYRPGTRLCDRRVGYRDRHFRAYRCSAVAEAHLLRMAARTRRDRVSNIWNSAHRISGHWGISDCNLDRCLCPYLRRDARGAWTTASILVESGWGNVAGVGISLVESIVQ